MGGFERLCWIITILASIAAGLVVATLFMHIYEGAAQEGAVAAAAAAIAVIPYVFTRGVQEVGGSRTVRRTDAERLLKQLVEQLERARTGSTQTASAAPPREAEPDFIA